VQVHHYRWLTRWSWRRRHLRRSRSGFQRKRRRGDALSWIHALNLKGFSFSRIGMLDFFLNFFYVCPRNLSDFSCRGNNYSGRIQVAMHIHVEAWPAVGLSSGSLCSFCLFSSTLIKSRTRRYFGWNLRGLLNILTAEIISGWRAPFLKRGSTQYYCYSWNEKECIQLLLLLLFF